MFSVFPCATPAEVRAELPGNADVVAFQCRNPVHRAHYELFSRALDAPNVSSNAVCLVHPTCGPTQGDDIPGIVRYHTYEVLKRELTDQRIKWAYLPYSMHMAGVIISTCVLYLRCVGSRSKGSNSAHDDQKELWLHTFHYWKRHGWIQKLCNRRRFLRSLRCSGELLLVLLCADETFRRSQRSMLKNWEFKLFPHSMLSSLRRRDTSQPTSRKNMD